MTTTEPSNEFLKDPALKRKWVEAIKREENCLPTIIPVQDELKDGTFVGQDELGNKYFENPRYFYGRNRWVEYNPKFNFDYDGSQVSAQWFGWLHYKTDTIPTQDTTRPKYKWMAPHTENLSGTTGQYVAYSTAPPKVQPWLPGK